VFRANKTASLVAVYVSNPLTMLPMYWIDYWLGALVLDRRFTYEELKALLNYQGWDGFKHAFWTLCVDLAGPMWLGGLVLALASAVPGYYVTRWAIERYQYRQPIPVAPTGEPHDAPSASPTAAIATAPLSTEHVPSSSP
jgi:hypothetical protein